MHGYADCSILQSEQIYDRCGLLERPLDNYYKEIDVVTTPHGAPVAMVHVNNFTSEITAWTNLFAEVVAIGGGSIERGKLFDTLYQISLSADEELGGLMGYNFLAGEPIANVARGIPMITRNPAGKLTLANFMKMHIYSALGSLSIGCDILKNENVQIDAICGHGGFFKSEFVGQSAMSAAAGAPITVMKNASEGGAFGIALLALFAYENGTDLDVFLDEIFKNTEKSTVLASDEEIDTFKAFMQKYKSGLDVERHAAEVFNA